MTTIKCPACGRTQEIDTALYNHIKNGKDALGNPFHPFTCTCGDHIEMKEVSACDHCGKVVATPTVRWKDVSEDTEEPVIHDVGGGFGDHIFCSGKCANKYITELGDSLEARDSREIYGDDE